MFTFSLFLGIVTGKEKNAHNKLLKIKTIKYNKNIIKPFLWVVLIPGKTLTLKTIALKAE